MRALFSTPTGWHIQNQPQAPLFENQVRVSMVLAGLCRTDIDAMTHKRPVPLGQVLGHEGAGVIEYIPPSLEERCAERQLFVGTRVAIWPFVPCGRCVHDCRTHIEQCLQPQVLGLHRDGVFASYVDVPYEVLFPSQLPWKALAYAEPMSASLALQHVPDLLRAPQVAVLGQGRIAQACMIVLKQLRAHLDLPEVQLITQASQMPQHLDAVVETCPQAPLLEQAVRALRYGGLMVIKSRPAQPVLWPHELIALKALQVQGAPYTRFTKALAWLEQHQVLMEPLWGDVYPFTEQGVAQALEQEHLGQETSGKLFFDLTEHGVVGSDASPTPSFAPFLHSSVG